MNYQITPIHLGKSRTDRSTLCFCAIRRAKRRILRDANAFLLRGEDGETVLFDTGTPEPEIMQQPDWRSARLQDARSYRKEIREAGSAAGKEGIDLIILSHLHWDHSYHLEHFPMHRFWCRRRSLH